MLGAAKVLAVLALIFTVAAAFGKVQVWVPVGLIIIAVLCYWGVSSLNPLAP